MLNIDYLKNRMQQIEVKNPHKEIKYVNFEEGKTYSVRFLPMDNGNFCKEYWLYYGIANQFFRCTFKEGKPDPIKEEFDRSMLDEELKNNWNYMKAFKPKLRCAAPVIVRGEEHKGVQVFTFNEKIYKDLISIFISPKYQNAVDPVSGFDLEIKAYKTRENWLRFDIKPADLPSQLNMDISVINDTTPNLDEIFTEYDYEKMNDLLRNYVNLNKPAQSWQSNAKQPWDASTPWNAGVKPF